MFLTHSGIREREDKQGNQERGRRKQSLSTCNCLATYKCTSPKRENIWKIQEHSHLKCLLLHRFSVVIFIMFIFSGLWDCRIHLFESRVALNPGLGGVSDVASAIIFH